MSEENRDPKPSPGSTSGSELTESQLEGTVGGAEKASTTKSQGAFEIKDFSFGVENPTTIGSS